MASVPPSEPATRSPCAASDRAEPAGSVRWLPRQRGQVETCNGSSRSRALRTHGSMAGRRLRYRPAARANQRGLGHRAHGGSSRGHRGYLTHIETRLVWPGPPAFVFLRVASWFLRSLIRVLSCPRENLPTRSIATLPQAHRIIRVNPCAYAGVPIMGSACYMLAQPFGRRGTFANM